MGIVNDVEGGLQEAGKIGREVVAKRVAVIAVITIVLNLGIGYGWFGDTVEKDILQWVGAAFDALTALLAVFAVRPAVTPTKDPRDDDGTPLVPVTLVTPPAAVAPGSAGRAMGEAGKTTDTK